MEGITHASPSASGCWCVFVKLNDTHGVKFYNTPATRDEAMALQANAHAVALGPAVGGKCDMPWMSSWQRPHSWDRESIPERVFGYITELVDTKEVSEDEFETLLEWLREYGISTSDLTHYNNVGKTKDGMIVRYDFDPIFYYSI